MVGLIYYTFQDGANGNDTYLFGRGSGQDIIYDYDKTAGNVDTILLNSDISPADVTFHKSDYDLVLSINDTSDTLTVSNWFGTNPVLTRLNVFSLATARYGMYILSIKCFYKELRKRYINWFFHSGYDPWR